jgi:hypothetical protein
MPLAARVFIVFLFILAVIGLWRLPRSDGPARSSIKFAVTAECPKKIAHNMNDPWRAVPGFGEGAVQNKNPKA